MLGNVSKRFIRPLKKSNIVYVLACSHFYSKVGTMSGNYRCENRLSKYSSLSRMRISMGINTDGGRKLKKL